MAKRAWTVHLYRDDRGSFPVREFLKRRTAEERASTLTSLRIVRELTRYQEPHTIGRPHVDTLEGELKELRPTNQVRIFVRVDLRRAHHSAA